MTQILLRLYQIISSLTVTALMQFGLTMLGFDFQVGQIGTVSPRAGHRAVDLAGPSVCLGGPKFEIKHKSRSLEKSKLVDSQRLVTVATFLQSFVAQALSRGDGSRHSLQLSA